MNASLVLDQFIRDAIAEDLGEGDHSSLACIPEDAIRTARLLVKEEGVLAGVEVAIKVFDIIDPQLEVEVFIVDGSKVRPGDCAFLVSGSARSILAAERLVLNMMQRMSGIATRTRQVVDIINGTGAQVLDTRKTTPGLRYFEKWAVRIGGGLNHRFGLYDMVMLKDNHIDYAGGIRAAMSRVRSYLNANKLHLEVEVEVRNFDELRQALQETGVTRVMLDNFTPEQVKEAVRIIAGRVESEASGGITIDDVESYAKAGVNYISMGALTHSVKSIDLSLKAVEA